MTEDVVFQSCKRRFRSRSARLAQSDTGEVGQQTEVGKHHASQRRQTTQKSPIGSVVPYSRLRFSERSMRLWTISFERPTHGATQSKGFRARRFHGLCCVSQADLQQLRQDRHGTIYVSGHA